METATKMFIRVRESNDCRPARRGDAEYSLIFAAIAVVAYGAYRAMDNNIFSLASVIGSTMTDACHHVLRHRR
jgi:hypothetical protein